MSKNDDNLKLNLPRTLNNASPTDAQKDGVVCDAGSLDLWECVVKVHHDGQGWMKSTKRLMVPGGWVVQVTSQQDHSGGVSLAEAICFVPDQNHIWRLGVIQVERKSDPASDPAPCRHMVSQTVRVSETQTAEVCAACGKSWNEVLKESALKHLLW